ncbi:ribokinase [Actinorhabdospora filicis]|uniref:Ribokinase n=1 Tax=Actinorhabdospora filicis TaxID=1785913 RepID=A0A9W6STN0_9ACTN|nr:carbohydrate kinase family protein [Actinorhabdospora filicis]GLZ80546.1 ribokinase [Actinorhabdospora filicis]
MSDVLVVALTGVDTIVGVDALPVPYRDSVMAPGITDYVGHTGNGVALGCHALGLATTFLDFLGEDDHGRLILDSYARRGLDFHWLPNPAGTSRSVNLVDAGGRRMSFYDPRDPGRDLPEDFFLPHLAKARHVHVSIASYALPVLDAAARLGVPSSTDLHDWDGRDPYHRRFAERAGLVFVSTANLADPAAAMREIRAIRGATVVAMSGADGCLVLDGGGLREHPAVAPPGPVADTNGAGDSFVAAYLAASLTGGDAVAAGLRGGAYAVTVPGTHESFLSEL